MYLAEVSLLRFIGCKLISPVFSILFVSILFFVSCYSEESIEEDFTLNTFGGSEEDIGYSVKQTSDGGFIITGSTESFGNGDSDVWLIKTNSEGEEEWNRTFGESGRDWGNTVLQTTDGGFIIEGMKDRQTGPQGHGNVWLIKTDSGGEQEWEKIFGGAFGDESNSIDQTEDGGYIITGSTRANVWLIKTDSQGEEEWSTNLGGNDYDVGNSVQQTFEGGFIITGTTGAASPTDVLLIKVNVNGNEEWEQTFGGSENDWGYTVQQTIDSGYVIIGYTESFGNGDRDILLIKTDSNGNEEWKKTYGGGNRDEGYSGQQTEDGGYIIVGNTRSFGISYDVWLIKTDSNGNEEWNKTHGGDYWDFGESVQQTSDGGYVVTGYTGSYGHGNYDVWLFKTDSEGNW